MFDLAKLWDRWLNEGETRERPSRDGDYTTRVEPPISGEAWEQDGDPSLPSRHAAQGEVADATLWTPPSLTV
jgi:hypothetical protein